MVVLIFRDGISLGEEWDMGQTRMWAPRWVRKRARALLEQPLAWSEMDKLSPSSPGGQLWGKVLPAVLEQELLLEQGH